MTTNFVNDAGRDPALLALLSSGAHDTIDLVYTGVPVRAHVRPLRPGLPWTLVVYRGHELEDTVGGLTAALSIFSTLLWLVVVAGTAGLVLVVMHWCRPRAPTGIPATLGRVMNVGSRFLWLTAASILLFLAGAWPILPFLAVGSVMIVAALVACCGSRRCSAKTGGGAGEDGGVVAEGRVGDDDPAKTNDRTCHRVLGLAALIAALAVAPTVLWFGHHRAMLGVGVNGYLIDVTLEAVDRAREGYRLDALRWHGAEAAPVGDRMRPRRQRTPQPEEGWVYGTLRPILASSELANQLLIRRAAPSAAAGYAPADHAPVHYVVSFHDVISRTFRYEVGRTLWPPSASGSGRFLVAVALIVLFLTLFVAAIAYSVCAACTIVRHRRHSLTKLPDAHSLSLPANGPPLRAIVVHRSEGGCGCSVEERAKRLSLNREIKKTLHVVDDLQKVLEHDAEGRKLLDKLEQRVKEKSHVLIWSRVVPDYRYSDRLERDDRWFDRGRWDDADRRDRWSRVALEFRTWVLDCSSVSKECRAANVTQWRKCAASRFNQLWTESTHDERLQLYAIARGGAVNARRTAALSSLVNRGIVKEDDETGVVHLRSEAFREFIEHDVDHGELKAWHHKGGGAWGFIWPPLAIGGALGLAFLVLANPETSGTLLATLVGLLPVVLPLLRGGGSTGTATGSE